MQFTRWGHLKVSIFLLIGNLYFIIKIEHNALGSANVLGCRPFVYCTFGIRDSDYSKFVSGIVDRLEAHAHGTQGIISVISPHP